MSAENFAACFAATERWEGWHQFSLDPRDPGGATWCGLTQKSYDAWRFQRKLPLQGVRKASDDEIRAIFHDEYWAQARCDDCFAGLDLVQFDSAINEGPAQATKILQRALGVAADGVFGLETLYALQGAYREEELIRKVCELRFSFWRGLRTFRYFGQGWMARGEDIEKRALEMLALSFDGGR